MMFADSLAGVMLVIFFPVPLLLDSLSDYSKGSSIMKRRLTGTVFVLDLGQSYLLSSRLLAVSSSMTACMESQGKGQGNSGSPFNLKFVVAFLSFEGGRT